MFCLFSIMQTCVTHIYRRSHKRFILKKYAVIFQAERARVISDEILYENAESRKQTIAIVRRWRNYVIKSVDAPHIFLK